MHVLFNRLMFNGSFRERGQGVVVTSRVFVAEINELFQVTRFKKKVTEEVAPLARIGFQDSQNEPLQNSHGSKVLKRTAGGFIDEVGDVRRGFDRKRFDPLNAGLGANRVIRVRIEVRGTGRENSINAVHLFLVGIETIHKNRVKKLSQDIAQSGLARDRHSNLRVEILDGGMISGSDDQDSRCAQRNCGCEGGVQAHRPVVVINAVDWDGREDKGQGSGGHDMPGADPSDVAIQPFAVTQFQPFVDEDLQLAGEHIGGGNSESLDHAVIDILADIGPVTMFAQKLKKGSRVEKAPEMQRPIVRTSQTLKTRHVGYDSHQSSQQ